VLLGLLASNRCIYVLCCRKNQLCLRIGPFLAAAVLCVSQRTLHVLMVLDLASGLGCWDGETRQVDRCVMVHLYVQRRGMWSKVQILWPDCRLAQMLVLAMLLSE